MDPQEIAWGLKLSAQEGHIEVVKMLLEQATFTEEDLAFALAIAKNHGHQEIEQLLTKK